MFAKSPFLGFVVFFITGILLDTYLFVYTDVSYLFVVSFLILSMVLSLWLYRVQSPDYSICLSLFIISTGAMAHVLQVHQLNSSLHSLSGKDYTAYQAQVQSLPEKRTKSIRLEVLVQAVKDQNGWQKLNSRALLSLNTDADIVPKPGDLIVVSGKLERAGLPLNPDEFDYRSYLWNKGIVWTDYIQDGSYQVISENTPAAGLKAWSMRLSEWADHTFRENIKDDKSYGLVKAMLLGRRDDLRSDQVDDYTTSGTVHILSVSGMHVAIIFLVISACLGWMKRWNTGRYVYLFLVSSLLCFYALVTGMPPSVQRATLMCIVFVMAEVFRRKQASINTLSISALLILIFDPNAIFDVGFQLSYLAMTGIFLLYQPIEQFRKPTNPILKYTWQITALSLAAQLATFPVSLYYFHQFPSYFWLINPFVIGFTNLLLPAAMVLLVFSLLNVSWMQAAVNWIVDISAYLTNVSVSVPKLLPGYLIDNLYLDKFEVVLLYGCIFLVWLSYDRQQEIWLKYSAVLTCLFVFYAVSISVQKYYTSTAMIHSVPRHSVISIREGNRLYISCDSAFISDTNAYDFRIKNFAIREGVLEKVFITEKSVPISPNIKITDTSGIRLISWNNRIIGQGRYISTSLPINYLLISSGLPPTISGSVRNTIFLAGGEIRGKRLEKWKKHLFENNFYDLSDGALAITERDK